MPSKPSRDCAGCFYIAGTTWRKTPLGVGNQTGLALNAPLHCVYLLKEELAELWGAMRRGLLLTVWSEKAKRQKRKASGYYKPWREPCFATLRAY